MITGAAFGIGRATAEHFARQGARLIVTDIQSEPLLALADELRRADAEVETVIGDVSVEADAQRMIGAAVDRFGRLDVLVANAGIIPLGDAMEVTTAGWDASDGELRHYERAGPGAPWRQVGGFPVSIGREGAAWGEGLHARQDQDDGPLKQEGDGRSPAGVFAIGEAFGYLPAAQVDTRLPYVQMEAGHYCMDVPDSPLYNRIVNAREAGTAAVAGSTEPMRLDLHRDGDPRYRLGLVIGHNPHNQPGGGSCIFAHLWRHPGEATSGCTAMAEADMRRLQAWLDPAAMPRLVLLPRAQYRRLAAQWRLPVPVPDR